MRPVQVACLRTLAAVMVGAVMLASCGTPVVSPSVSPSVSPTSAPQAPSPSPAPSPSTAALLNIDTLPDASLDPSTMTVLCDPTPGQTNMDAGESMFGCTDGPVLALRAIRTVATVPVTRLYLRRAACPTGPCTADQLDTAVVVGWTSEGAFSVALDSRLATVTAPVLEPAAAWPDPGAPTVPAIQRPVIPGAPKEVATRTTYPFCERQDLAGVPNPAAALCFIDAVIAGRPAEFIEQVYGVEGGAILRLYRFSGQGAPLLYQGETGHWFRQAGGLILDPPVGPRQSVDFEPWPETYAVIH